jgi:plastocyanin
LRRILVVLALLAASTALAGCAAVGGGGAPTETEPPTYYTGGLGGPGSTAQQSQRAAPVPPTSSGNAAPPTSSGNAAPPTSAQPAPPPTTAGQPAGAFAAVDIENFAYTPGTMKARVGQKVVWSNQDDAPHTVTANNLTWGRNIAPGSTYVRAFDRPGTFPYHCAIHPNMRGTVVVS